MEQKPKWLGTLGKRTEKGEVPESGNPFFDSYTSEKESKDFGHSLLGNAFGFRSAP